MGARELRTVVEVIVSFLASSPGSANPEIRSALEKAGQGDFTRKSLNQLLYRLHPETLRWEELRMEDAAGMHRSPSPQQTYRTELDLKTDGAWAPSGRMGNARPW